MTKETSLKWLQSLLIINLVSTIIHYIDNYIFFDQYPLPDWVVPEGVYISWLILTPFAFLGYWLYHKRLFWLAYGCLCIYSVTATSSLLHYFYAPPLSFGWKMNLLICSDGIAGTALISFIVWSLFFHQEWRKVTA